MSGVDKETRGRINPVYILLDIGKNMWGKPIDLAVKVIRALIDNLKADPQDLETTWISEEEGDGKVRMAALYRR